MQEIAEGVERDGNSWSLKVKTGPGVFLIQLLLKNTIIHIHKYKRCVIILGS